MGLWAVLRAIWFVIVGIPIFYVVAVLFGAPLLSELYETLTFAIALSCLVFFPLGLTFTSYDQLGRLVFENRPDTKRQLVAQRIAFGSVLGAWGGAAVIPLDWDRPWQIWPTPCVAGGVIGAFLGLLLAIFALRCGPLTFSKRQKWKIV
uniref:Phosphatidylinositol-glycan biosynthesis class F protein n=1 Tax=Plectus sambesii TaxID=2011161 RepID=A0A914WW34_9BILA